jgi:hypothetical protein
VPLDGNMGMRQYDRAAEFLDRAMWERKFAWWPRRCMFGGRLMWLKYVHMGTAIWTGPGDCIFEVRWSDPDEYIMWLLRR